MKTLKKILAVVWDRIVVILGAVLSIKMVAVTALAVGETRPAYEIDWGFVGLTVALIYGLTAFGWELRRLVKGE